MEANLLQVWHAAHTLELPHIADVVMSQLVASVSVGSCLYYLEVALQLEGEAPGIAALRRACQALVLRRPLPVLTHDGALHLSQAAMEHLLRRDDLCLPEESVWHWLLQWGRFHAGFKTDSKFDPSVLEAAEAMSDEDDEDEDDANFGFGSSVGESSSDDTAELVLPAAERAAVGEAVAGLLPCVRLLLMSPQFFDTAVAPLGLLPRELLTARSQHLHGGARLPADHELLRPRLGANAFADTEVLGAEQQRVLNSWYGDVGAKWDCVFSTGRDGDSCESVLRACKGRCPTFVVAQTTTGHTVGGFSWDVWGEEALHRRHARARSTHLRPSFLFSVDNTEGSLPCKFEARSGEAGLRLDR